jgi:hypothetical protein
MYIAGVFLMIQLAGLLATPGARDAEGLVKGHDFVQFYATGSLAREGRFDVLYDSAAVNRRMWTLVPESAGDVFPPLYGPQVALAFAPLSALPYVPAVHAWLCISAIVYIAACGFVVSLAGALPVSRTTTWVLLLLSPSLNVLLVAGQTTAVALFAVCCAWWLLARGRPVAAGVAFGMLVYKPQLLVGPVLLLTACREWRLLAGIATGALAQIGLAWAVTGTATMMAYAVALSGPISRAAIPEPLPQHVHGLAGALRLLLGHGPVATLLFFASAGGVLALGVFGWRRAVHPRERMANLVLVSVLLSAHLYVYDLLLLTPALAAAWHAAGTVDRWPDRWRVGLVGLAWLAPLTGPIAAATRIQCSTIVLVALLWLSAKIPSTAGNEKVAA